MGFTGWPPISVLWVSGPRRALPMDPVSEPIPGIPGPAAPGRGSRGDGLVGFEGIDGLTGVTISGIGTAMLLNMDRERIYSVQKTGRT